MNVELNVLRRVAREAANTYVGAHWPSMETLRYNGIGADFVEKREKDAAIRRFLSTYSPDVILALLDRIAELEKAPHSIQPTDLTGEDGERTGLCGFCRKPIYENGDLRGGRFRHGEYRSSSKVETGVEK